MHAVCLPTQNSSVGYNDLIENCYYVVLFAWLFNGYAVNSSVTCYTS